MPFGMVGRVGQLFHVIDEGPALPMGRSKRLDCSSRHSLLLPCFYGKTSCSWNSKFSTLSERYYRPVHFNCPLLQTPMQCIACIINCVCYYFHAHRSAVQLSVDCSVLRKQWHAMKTAVKCPKSNDKGWDLGRGLAPTQQKQNTKLHQKTRTKPAELRTIFKTAEHVSSGSLMRKQIIIIDITNVNKCTESKRHL